MRLFLLAISLFQITLSARSADYDDLNQWKDTTLSNTERISALNKYIWGSLIFSKPDRRIRSRKVNHR